MKLETFCIVIGLKVAEVVDAKDCEARPTNEKNLRVDAADGPSVLLLVAGKRRIPGVNALELHAPRSVRSIAVMVCKGAPRIELMAGIRGPDSGFCSVAVNRTRCSLAG